MKTTPDTIYRIHQWQAARSGQMALPYEDFLARLPSAYETNLTGLLLPPVPIAVKITVRQALAPLLRAARLLVIPPPVGRYEARRERWRRQPHSLFNSDEVRELLGFLHGGGRLLAFAYRFGDSFTQTNLGDLCLALPRP